jgi:uncharacterized membrane protein YdbT with pleckstrin-like domain
MVGVRKATVDLSVLNAVPILDSLIRQYYTIEISCDGSPEHEKAGLSKEKVLIKAYGKR